MKTALDSNIISALWSSEKTVLWIESFLSEAHTQGQLVISAPVYCELCAHPNMTKTKLDEFLINTRCDVDFEMSRSIWIEAGQAYAAYANRRRQSSGQQPKRLLSDFIIGAHANVEADRLATLDTRRYRQDFPKLLLVSPPA